MKKEDIYNIYRKDDNCFPLIKKCIEELIIIDEDIFIKKWWDYDYYIREMFYEITPYCWCWSDDIDKVNKLLFFLNKWNREDWYVVVYENELLYSYMDKEWLFEHWTSIWSCWLTDKWKFVISFLEIYKTYLTR